MYFNAQSVCQIAGEINDFVVDNKLDVLILTETWLQEVGDEAYIKEMIPLNNAIHSFLCFECRGGGTAVLISKSFAPKLTF